jgi:hypothetical protein
MANYLNVYDMGDGRDWSRDFWLFSSSRAITSSTSDFFSSDFLSSTFSSTFFSSFFSSSATTGPGALSLTFDSL